MYYQVISFSIAISNTQYIKKIDYKVLYNWNQSLVDNQETYIYERTDVYLFYSEKAFDEEKKKTQPIERKIMKKMKIRRLQ